MASEITLGVVDMYSLFSDDDNDPDANPDGED